MTGHAMLVPDYSELDPAVLRALDRAVTAAERALLPHHHPDAKQNVNGKYTAGQLREMLKRHIDRHFRLPGGGGGA